MAEHKAQYYYESQVEWTGGKRGVHAKSPGPQHIEVTAPPEFNGEKEKWTPENLFVTSVNACFAITFLAIAENSKLEFYSFASRASGKLEKAKDSGYRFTEIILKPKLVVNAEKDLELGKLLLQKSEERCLVSNSINTTVKLEPQIEYIDSATHRLARRTGKIVSGYHLCGGL